MTFFATPRLVRATALSAALLVAAVMLGRVELVAIAVPFLLVLTGGREMSDEGASVEARTEVTPARVLEGEEVTVRLFLGSERGEEEIEYGLTVPPGLELVSGEPHKIVASRPGREVEEEIVLVARRWGAYDLGRIAVRVHTFGSLASAEAVLDRSERVRVYPRAEPVRARPKPPQTQVFSGNYVARSRGEGIEFAAVRQFSAGDSVRRVNWRVTARRRGLYVNQHHPERNADVVFFVDSFSDVGPPGNSSLDLAVRGTAALARHYLSFKDRVGLVSFGGIVGWLNASTGETHVHRIVDYLLDVGVHPSYAWKDVSYLPPRLLPPMSLVVLFSPLIDGRAITAIHDLKRRGHDLIVVDLLNEALVGPEDSAEGRVAFRAWKLRREALRFALSSSGIAVVGWNGTNTLEEALAEVPPFARTRPA